MARLLGFRCNMQRMSVERVFRVFLGIQNPSDPATGVAGLCYALEVAKHGSVAVITKAKPHENNTNYAQGGVSVVLCPMDSVESHIRDTIIVGAYLCDEETVRVVCTE